MLPAMAGIDTLTTVHVEDFHETRHADGNGQQHQRDAAQGRVFAGRQCGVAGFGHLSRAIRSAAAGVAADDLQCRLVCSRGILGVGRRGFMHVRDRASCEHCTTAVHGYRWWSWWTVRCAADGSPVRRHPARSSRVRAGVILIQFAGGVLRWQQRRTLRRCRPTGPITWPWNTMSPPYRSVTIRAGCPMRRLRSCFSLKLASSHTSCSGMMVISGSPGAIRCPSCTLRCAMKPPAGATMVARCACSQASL